MEPNVSIASPVNNTRTVSDTKRAFYSHHPRPINALYRRVIEELMVEMHLLSVHADFTDNPVYDLGVVTSFDRFMVGYLPESDKPSIFAALCQAVDGHEQHYRAQSEALTAALQGMALTDLKAQFEAAETGGSGILSEALHAVVTNPKYKYSRLFAIGLYTLIEKVDEAVLAEKESRNEVLDYLAQALKLSGDKIQRDLELYRSNLEKMVQAQEVMQDILAAERKKREERTQAKATALTAETEAAANKSTETAEDVATEGPEGTGEPTR